MGKAPLCACGHTVWSHSATSTASRRAGAHTGGCGARDCRCQAFQPLAAAAVRCTCGRSLQGKRDQACSGCGREPKLCPCTPLPAAPPSGTISTLWGPLTPGERVVLALVWRAGGTPLTLSAARESCETYRDQGVPVALRDAHGLAEVAQALRLRGILEDDQATLRLTTCARSLLEVAARYCRGGVLEVLRG